MAFPDAVARGGAILEHVPVVGVIDIDRSDLDAMLNGITHDLRWGIKTHGLAVEQCAGKHIRVVALEPARGINEEREGSRVAFGEAVFAKTLDLAEAAFGEFDVVAVLDHAGDELVAELGDLAGTAPGRHGPAELVGLARREPGTDDGDLHRLLLE